MRFVAKTDVGKKRKNNEDSFFAKIFDKHSIEIIDISILCFYQMS